MLYAYKKPKIFNFEAVFPCIFFRHHIFLRSIKYRAVTRHITPLPTCIVQPAAAPCAKASRAHRERVICLLTNANTFYYFCNTPLHACITPGILDNLHQTSLVSAVPNFVALSWSLRKNESKNLRRQSWHF